MVSPRRLTRKADKGKPKKNNFLCPIPIPAHALKYSLNVDKECMNDFYSWVNKDWLSNTSIPPTKAEYGISDEVERCIFNTSTSILKEIKGSNSKKEEIIFLQKLADSCLDSRSQQNSVDLLKELIRSIHCIQTKEDITRAFAVLCKRKLPSLFSLQYTIDSDRKLQFLIDGNVPSLPLFFYKNADKMKAYKTLLHNVCSELECSHVKVDSIVTFEKSLVYGLENKWSDVKTKTNGYGLQRKFPGIPWGIWFEALEIPDWKSRTFYYQSPRWIRWIGRLFKEVPFHYWRAFLVRAYCIPLLKYLPPPFDELDFDFFQKEAQGQKEKTPQIELLTKIVYNHLPDLFSRLFWEKEGSEELEHSVKGFVKSIQTAAKHHVAHTDWLERGTRQAAIEKIDRMNLQIVRPSSWSSFDAYDLNDKNLLHNIFTISEHNTKDMIKKIGHSYKFWEEGIYRVNAYYFSDNNEMMIPYGTTLSPFYSIEASPAWNYGALGSIIGHEMCHGFDEDGKNYDSYGQKKKWWTRGDNLQYHYKTKELINMYSKQEVAGEMLDGKKTLSENIADLGGLGISLQALKEYLKSISADEKKILEAYREFFIAYATSWRTLYRKERLKHVVHVDRHSPAFLRVNLVVSQFNEWYEAFGVKEDSLLYRKPEDRIIIF